MNRRSTEIIDDGNLVGERINSFLRNDYRLDGLIVDVRPVTEVPIKGMWSPGTEFQFHIHSGKIGDHA
jgi:hypothetical protein